MAVSRDFWMFFHESNPSGPLINRTLSLRQKNHLSSIFVKKFHGVQICWNFCNFLLRFKVKVKTVVSKLLLTVHIINNNFVILFVLRAHPQEIRSLGNFWKPLHSKNILTRKTYFYFLTLRTFFGLF